MMLRGRVLVAMWFALAATLGGCCCGPVASEGLTGEYTLQTVNGTALPATLGPLSTIHAGSLALRSGGRYAFTIDASAPDAGPVPARRVATEEGTYTSDGNSISLSYDDADADAAPVTGVVSGNTLTLAMPSGGAWVFVR